MKVIKWLWNEIYSPECLKDCFKYDPLGTLFLIIPIFYGLPFVLIVGIVQYITTGKIK